MPALAFLLVLLLSAAPDPPARPAAHPPSDALAWGSLPEALAAATESGQPILVFVHAPGCGPCLRMERATFTDPAVRALLARFERAGLDFDDKRAGLRVGSGRISPFDLARRWGVETTPGLVALAPGGRPVGSRTGYLAPDALRPLLEQILAAHAAAR